VFILLGIHVITRRRVQRRRKGGGGGGREHVKGKINSPTSKIYTTRAHILSDRAVFCTLRGEGKTAESNAPGVVSCPRPPLGQNNTCQ